MWHTFIFYFGGKYIVRPFSLVCQVWLEIALIAPYSFSLLKNATQELHLATGLTYCLTSA